MGKLYKTLHNIELARRTAVKNAQAANLPATDNLSLMALADLYRYQNNKEDIIEGDDDEEEEYGVWREPEGWPDIKTLLEESEPIEYDGYTYQPFFSIILNAQLPFTNKLTSSNYYYLLKTSDGQLVLDYNRTANTELPWDKTKDIRCSDGSVVRYIIVYKREDKIVDTNDLSHLNFRNYPVMAVCYGNYVFSNPGSFSDTSASNNAKYNHYILTVDALPLCRFTKFEKYFQQCDCLSKLHFPLQHGYEINDNPTAIGYARFYTTWNLRELSLPGLVKWGKADNTGANTDITNQKCLEKINLPDLEETGSYLYIDNSNLVCKNPFLKEVNIPKLKRAQYLFYSYYYKGTKSEDFVNSSLETLTKGILYQGLTHNFSSIKLLSLKELTSTSAALLSVTGPLKVFLPSLEKMNFTNSSYSYIFSFTEDITHYEELVFSCPSLTEITSYSEDTLFLINVASGYVAKALFEFNIIEDLKLSGIAYNGGNKGTYVKIVAPNLKTLQLKNFDSNGTSGSAISRVTLVHDDKIDVTLKYFTTSTSGFVSGRIIDEKINHFTIENGSCYAECLGGFLSKAHIDKLTCSIKDYLNTTTKWIDAHTDYLAASKIFTQDNIILDLASGSALDKGMGQWLSEEQFAKIFTNLIELPSGESRTFTLGTNLTKLSAETKAIATNKGWVLN